MKDIKRLVGDLELNITEDQLKKLEEGVRENYITRPELEEKTKRIEALTKQVEELSTQAKGIEDANEQVTALQAKVKEFEEAEAQRQADETERKARAKFSEEFAEVVGERKFSNELTKASVMDKAYEKQTANPDMKLSEILTSITDSIEGVWANPQADPRKMPKPSGKDTQADTADYVRKLFSK